MPSLKQSSHTAIPDPFATESVRERCATTTYVSNSFYSSFVIGTLGRTKGALNAITNQLLSKLHAESTKRGIPAVWEPGNESAILVLLADLNFTPQSPAPRKRTPARRTNLATPVPSPQPNGEGHVAD